MLYRPVTDHHVKRKANTFDNLMVNSYLDAYRRFRLLLSNLMLNPGILLFIFRYMASSGCTRITSSLVALSKSVPKFRLYKLPGTCLNWTLISALQSQPSYLFSITKLTEKINDLKCRKRRWYRLVFKAFPAFIKNGTPSHLALSIKRAAAANVGVRLPFGTVGSSI